MSIKPKQKASTPQEFKDTLLEKIHEEISFQNALFRISNFKEKIKGKRWYDTEWGYLYLTPRQYLDFLCNQALKEE